MNNEIILEIKEITDFEIPERYGSFDGYHIITNKQDIKILISNDQSCCETWGYLCSEDNPTEFIGASLLDVIVVDEELKTHSISNKFEEAHVDFSSGGSAIFVNLETSKGTLQFTVYNEHNGYYGHDAKVLIDGKEFISIGV